MVSHSKFLPMYQTPLPWQGQIHSSNLMIDVFQISFETFLRPTLFPGRHQDVEWVNFGRWLKPPASFNLRILSFKEAGEIRISMKTYFPAKECSSQSIDLPREAHLDLSYAMISKEAISRNKRGSYKECLFEIGRPEFFSLLQVLTRRVLDEHHSYDIPQSTWN